MSLPNFSEKKQTGKKITMVTCYDYWSAKIVNQTPIDALLVGDSAAMVIHGHRDTLPIGVEQIATHTQAVRRGAPEKFVIGDMPFLSFRKDLSTNLSNAEALMKAGANAVKMEGAKGNLELIRHMVESGIPVMGHLGLTPQFIHIMGGFKVQGRSRDQAQHLRDQAQQLQDAGCFSLVLECVPSTLARDLSKTLRIPTIGIGAGPDTDGQVLVMQDLLGLNGSFKPKFLRKFLGGEALFIEAFNKYHEAVINQDFPSIEESYE